MSIRILSIWVTALVLTVLAGPAAAAPGARPPVTGVGGPPSISSRRAVDLTPSDATLTATIQPGGETTEYRIWLLDPCPAPEECIAEVIAAEGTLRPSAYLKKVEVNLAQNPQVNLEHETSYEYWVTASNASGHAESSHGSFELPPSGRAPELLTQFVDHYTKAGAVIHVTFADGYLPTEWTAWLTAPCPLPLECSEAAPIAHGTSRPRQVQPQLHIPASGLATGTRYQYWVTLENSAGTIEGAHGSFTTPSG